MLKKPFAAHYKYSQRFSSYIGIVISIICAIIIRYHNLQRYVPSCYHYTSVTAASIFEGCKAPELTYE